MITVVFLDRRATPDHVGLIPGFLDESDPRPASEQFNSEYQGGWRPMDGFKLKSTTLNYPGDPPMKPLAAIAFRTERILIYPHAWVVIIQHDGAWEAARMD